MKVGRRLAMKVLNASKFVLGSRRRHRPRPGAGHRAGRPRPARAGCSTTCERRPRRSRPTTTRPPSRSTERFFWEFCDDYLELVKERAYDEADAGLRLRAARRPGVLAAHRAAAARAVPARTSPRRSGRGGRRARSTVASWPDCSMTASRSTRPRPARRRRRGPGRHPRREVPGQGLDARPARPRRGDRPRRPWSRPPRRPPTTSAAPATSRRPRLHPVADATEISVAAELARPATEHRFVCGSACDSRAGARRRIGWPGGCG